MELDFTLRVTVEDHVLTLLERLVAVLERKNPASDVLATLAPLDGTAPVPADAKPPRGKRNVGAVWTPERRARQADILRKALARKRGELTIEPPADVIEPIPTRFVAEPPPSPPPVPRDPQDDTPRVRSFEAIRGWAERQRVPFRTWDDLPAVNKEATRLGLSPFARPESAVA